MTRRKHSTALAAAVVLLLAAAPGLAEEAGAGSFSGSFLLGVRAVDVDGAERKYREDYDYDDGPRLFDLSFDLVPAGELRGFADRVRLDIANYGGDPYETLGLTVKKLGAYDFRYHRRKSSYFYEDLILPLAESTPSLSDAGDFHHFDFDRVRDAAQLAITLSPAAKLRFGFDRFTKEGESTTTLDVSRDEFELDRPIDETLDTYFAGLEYSWDKATLVLEERYRDYENLVEIFLPGFSLGEDAEDATTLDFFFLDQPYDFTSNEHTARLVAQPGDRLTLRVSASLQDLDLDVAASERSQGTSFAGQPFATDLTGGGEIERRIELADVDATFAVSRRVALVAGVRQRRLDQQGRTVFGSAENLGSWEIDTVGAELGLAVNPSPALSLAGGVRWEEREVDSAHNEGDPDDELERERVTTEQTGFFATAGWRPSRTFRLSAEVEESSFDDPFTLIAPTDRRRARVRGEVRAANGLRVTGSYQQLRIDNTPAGWRADSDQASLRLGWRNDRLELALGYALVDSERQVDQTVVTLPGFGGGAELFYPVFSAVDASFVDARVGWKWSHRVSCGGYGRLYENSGSFALDRSDLRAWVETGIGAGYVLRLGYRVIDYDEDRTDFDDYEADIAEVAFGYRW